MNEAIFNHEPYQIREIESNDYGFEDGVSYHLVTIETEIVDAGGQDITRIAFFEEVDGQMWPFHTVIGYR